MRILRHSDTADWNGEKRASMFQHLDEHIARANEHAAYYRQRALATTDQASKADLTEIEKAWLELAEHCKMLKSVEDFLLDSARHKERPPNPQIMF